MDLKDVKWGEFVIGDIFEISSTSSGIDKNKLSLSTGNIPYVTRTELRNGYGLFVGEQSEMHQLDSGNVITIGLDTQTVFYQSTPFYTGQNIQILKFRELNKNVAKFIIPLLKKQMVKFNWGGNGATLSRLKKTKILLPISADLMPDYSFMEKYIEYFEKDKKNNYVEYLKRRISKIGKTKRPLNFKALQWKEFEIGDIAEIVHGRDIYESERILGETPYVTATANNNGIGYFIGNKNLTLEKNCLSVNRNGSVGYSFFHPYYALFSNDCRKLRLKHNNYYVGLFIANQITQQREKYSYGYKMGTARLRKQKIMLPVKDDLTPDYEFMENYVRFVERQKLETYLKMQINS